MSAEPGESRPLQTSTTHSESGGAPDRGDAVVHGTEQHTVIYREHQAPWLTPARLLSLIGVVVGAWGVLVIVRALRTVLVMLLLSLFLSFAMEPAVQFLGRRGWRRGPATAAVFIVVLLTVAGVIAAMVPLVVQQVNDFIRALPANLERLSDRTAQLPLGIDIEASPELRSELFRFTQEFGDRVREIALGAASNVVDIGATALGVMLQLAAVALITFYLVAHGPRFRRTLAQPLPPDRQREMLAIWELAVTKTGGYIYSRLLLAVVAAATTGLFLIVVQVPYPIPLALWVGVTSAFVPVIGTYLGGILVVLVAFVGREPLSALWVIAFIVVYQQMENYFIAPRIHGRTMEIHPAVAFISVVIGGVLLGAVGALLALPAAAIIQALLSTYVRRHELIDELAEVELPADGPAPSREAKPLRVGDSRRGEASP